MTIDVSRLGIVVESKGIREAGTALTGLGTRAEKAESKIDNLAKQMLRLSDLFTKGTAAQKAYMDAIGMGTAALSGMRTEAQQAATSVTQLNAAFGGIARDAATLRAIVNQTATAVNNLNTALSKTMKVPSIFEAGKGGLSKLNEFIEKTSKSVGHLDTALGAFGTKSSKFETRIENLIKQVDRLNTALQNGAKAAGLYASAFQSGAASFSALRNELQQTATAVAGLNQAFAKSLASKKDTATSVDGLRYSYHRLGDSLERIAAINHRNNRSWYEHNHLLRTAVTTMEAMATAAVVYGSLGLAKSVVQQSDAWALMNARLSAAMGSSEYATAAQEKMFEVSQRLRIPLEDSIRLYQRLYPAMRKFGKSGEDVAKTVEQMAMGLKLSGATGAEAASVMLQLSQSASSGVINGAEFNAVAENGGLIMRALEGYYEKSSYALKKMGSEGKLTFDMLVTALNAYSTKWQADFAKMPYTVEDALTVLKNQWMKTTGEMGKDSDLNASIVRALSIVKDSIPTIVREFSAALKVLSDTAFMLYENLGAGATQVGLLLKDLSFVGDIFVGIAFSSGQVEEDFSLIGSAAMGLRVTLEYVQTFFVMIGSQLLKVSASIAGIGAVIWENIRKPVSELIDSLLGVGQHIAARLGADDLRDRLYEIRNAIRADASEGGQALFFKSLQAQFEQSAKDADDYILGMEERLSKLTDPSGFRKDPSSKAKASLPGAGKVTQKLEDTDGAKKAAAATKEYLSWLNKLTDALKAQRELSESIATFGPDYDKLTEFQKWRILLEREYGGVAEKNAGLEADRAKVTLWISRQLEAEDRLNKAMIEQNKALQTARKNSEDEADRVAREAAEWANKAAAIGGLKGAVDELTAAQYREKASFASAMAQEFASVPALAEEYRQMAVAYEKAADAAQSKAFSKDMVEAYEAGQQLEKMLDPAKAEKFGEKLKSAFGEAGVAVGQLVDAMRKYAAIQYDVQKMQEVARKEYNNKIPLKVQQEIADKQAQSQVEAYAEMMGAGKKFFKETSKGYKMITAAEKAFRIFEAAIAAKNYAMKIGMLSTETNAQVSSAVIKSSMADMVAGKEIAANIATMNSNIVANEAKQASNATTAMTSALAAPFPVNIAAVAAVAAMLASLGVAVKGMKGGGASLEDRQAAQNTGTVLGDSSAKSESIKNALENLSDNSDIALKYSQGMLASLQNIEQALTGVSTKLFSQFKGDLSGVGGSSGYQSFGDFVKGNINTMLRGGLITNLDGFVKNLFGSSKSVKDYGIAGGAQSLESILSSGFQGKLFTTIEKKKKVAGITYDTDVYDQISEMSAVVEQGITLVFRDMSESLKTAGSVVGVSASALNAALNSVVVAFDKTSLKGMTSDEISEELMSWASGIGDKMVQAVFGTTFDAFQQSGEGLYETVIRVANGVEVAQFELNKLGVSAIDFQDITRKQGDVAAEIVRQSLLAVSAYQGISDILKTISGEAADIAEAYSSLLEVQKGLEFVGLSAKVSADLLKAAGGLESLQDALSAYTEGFFTEAEQNAMRVAKMRAEFAKLGLAMPATNEAFRALVESLDANGNDALAMKVILLSGAFADLTSSADSAIESMKDALREAYDREAGVLKDTIDSFESLLKSLKEFKDSLILGDLSTLTTTQKYATSESKLQALFAKAMSGDTQAANDFQGAASEFLKFSREMFSSGAQYTSDYMKVLEQIDALSVFGTGQKDIATQQLDALTQSVSALITINESVLSVSQAIANLQSAMGLGVNALDGSHAGGLSNVPYNGYTAELHAGERILTAAENKAYQAGTTGNNGALVEELKALREEVKQLRTEQKAGLKAVVVGQYDSTDKAADKVVKGGESTASKAAYKQSSKVVVM